MRKVLGSLGATLAVALVMAGVPVSAGGWLEGGNDGWNSLVPTAMAASPAGTAGLAAAGMALDPDGLEGVVLPLNDTRSAAPGTVRTPGAPEFGFDVSVQTARPFFPDGIDNARPFGFDLSMQTSHDQLSGGWHDPGDHVKFGFPRVVSAGAYEDELVWGAIWI
jgi:hypothetical protein